MHYAALKCGAIDCKLLLRARLSSRCRPCEKHFNTKTEHLQEYDNIDNFELLNEMERAIAILFIFENVSGPFAAGLVAFAKHVAELFVADYDAP